MCGILSEFVEAKGDTAKKPKSDKQHFREWIRNVDRQQTDKGEENFKEHVIAGTRLHHEGGAFFVPLYISIADISYFL